MVIGLVPAVNTVIIPIDEDSDQLLAIDEKASLG